MSVRFAIVGAGKVGAALARLLSGAGYGFLGAASRSIESARRACDFAGAGRAVADAVDLTCDAELVFITTPDDAIEEVCRRLSERGAFAAGTVVAHCSGALASTILQPARDSGAHTGSLHPLQSFATAEQAVELLPGSCCCIEGDAEAVGALQAAAEAMGARAMNIATDSKALYHAAAVVSCNFLVALQHAALKIGEAAGMPRDEALQALLPLIRGTVSNLEQVGIPESLTGPIARGDVETTRSHLEALAQGLPDLLSVYRILAAQTIEVALAKGTLDEPTATRLRELLGQ